MIKTSILTGAIALSLFTPVVSANNCQSQLHGINAGRGDVGLLFSLDEESGAASAHSVAAFSAAALAYDSTSKRMYYVSSPQPATYKVDTSHLALSDELRAHLPISGEKFNYIRLAYYDYNTRQHVVVGRTKQVLGLVYDETLDALLGESYGSLYQIDKNTGEAQELGHLNNPDGYHRGDLVIKNNQLYLVTASSLYQIDRSNYQVTKVADHDLKSVTGAALAQSGKIVISEVINNDYGYTNKTRLFELDNETGKTCYISTLPVRLNDLASKDDEAVACYSKPICTGGRPSIPSIRLESNVEEIIEGGNLEYSVVLSNAYDEDVVVQLEINDITTTPADYRPIPAQLTIPSGQTSANIIIETIDDSEYSESLSFTLNVEASKNATGSASATGTIVNDDEQCTPIPHTRISYQFVNEDSVLDNDWGIRVSGRYIKLLDERGPSGYYDVQSGYPFDYVLAINGDSNNLTLNYRINGNTQYWEDQNDADFNDFVVNVTTQSILKGCQ
ncbi:hypothetical protein PALB_35140 [Pseudoalteromonas luteoviolacea B = ATCC 29581]|nr:hypothetical protein PALB_35140 [Pseudoalteromonas luteoviolacea B = ATCC 29581]